VNMLTPSKACGGINDVALGIQWDAAALNDEVARRAALLTRKGIRAGSVVAIGHGGTARFFADLFACWHIGAVAACLDPSLTPSETRNVVGFAKASLFLFDDVAPIDIIPAPVANLHLERSQHSSLPATEVDPDQPALILFTSGTTGAPKGVVLSFRALQQRMISNVDAIGRSALACSLVSLPTHFGHGLIGNSLTPLFSGGRIVLHPLGIALAGDLGRIIDEHGITFMSSVPSLWRLVLGRSDQPERSSLRRVHVGSAPFPAGLWSEVAGWSNAEVVNCYGATETANWISGASSRTDSIADGLVGHMWGGQAAIIDSNGQIQKSGSGELLIKSPSFMSGYLDRPDLTAAVSFDGWYRTGDQGSIDKQGRLWLAGRLKDEINRGGFKIQPAEVDLLLESNSDVAEACVFGISDPLGGETIAAAIRLVDGALPNSQRLQAWCRERLRREAVPETWFFVSEIPRTGRGKVSRDAVRRALVKETAGAGPSPDFGSARAERQARPKDTAAIQAAIKFAWTTVLGRNSYKANVPLSQTDADSLDVMRLWLLMEKSLGAHLSMDVLDSDPDPIQLAAELEKQLQLSTEASTPQTPFQNLPTVFLMLPAGGDLPDLARFRVALRSKIRFVLIRYPDWREMIDAGSGFHALVDSAVIQICEQWREGDAIFLAGYSFGGLVAIEATRRLIALGRRVGFVGLIDTRAVNPQTVLKRMRRFLARRSKSKTGFTETQGAGHFRTPVTGPPSRWQALISALILARAYRALKVVGRLEALLPAKQAFTLDSAINWRLRTESLRRLRLQSIEAPLTLFRSDEGLSSSDYGWSSLCRNLTVVPVGGTHETMMSHPILENLCRQFQHAVELASLGSKDKRVHP
jgi:acyl-CoA synthetase (AMP-forming)/AMP-acid ligase II/thioesterase domain-containing protein